MKRGLFLNVVIRKCSPIFELFSSENQSLLLGRNSFLVLDLRLDILDGVIGLDVQSDGLAGQRFHEDLHGTTTKTKNEMERGLFLNVVVRKCSAVFELLASENQSLL